MKKRSIFLSGLFFAAVVFVGGAGAVSLVPADSEMSGAAEFRGVQYPYQPRWERQQFPDLERAPINPGMVMAFQLICRAYGTPNEFPNDVAIINEGPGTAAAGTILHWKMTSPNFEGQYTLKAPLLPGRMLSIPDVLGSGVGAGKHCTVRVLR